MNNKIKSTLKFGFTLAETLITLALIGTIAAMTMPSLKAIIPDKYDAMRKKADYAIEHVVSDIVNDQYLYGEIRNITKAQNGENIVTITRGLSNINAVVVDGVSYSGESKFCKLVASKFNRDTNYPVRCDSPGEFLSGSNINAHPDFVTNDGIQFILPKSSFIPINDASGRNIVSDQAILFKTSMPADKKAPNCMYLPVDFYKKYQQKLNVELSGHKIKVGERNGGKTLYYTTDENQCKHPDTFIYFITPEGRLYKPEYGKFNIREMSDFTIVTGK